MASLIHVLEQVDQVGSRVDPAQTDAPDECFAEFQTVVLPVSVESHHDHVDIDDVECIRPPQYLFPEDLEVHLEAVGLGKVEKVREGAIVDELHVVLEEVHGRQKGVLRDLGTVQLDELLDVEQVMQAVEVFPVTGENREQFLGGFGGPDMGVESLRYGAEQEPTGD